MSKPATPVSLLQRIRIHRFSTTFVLLSTLSVGILAGSVLARGVHGKESQSINSSDATPLKIPNPTILSNQFSVIAKQVGPAVVNINTEITPKAMPPRRGNRRAAPNTPNGDDDQNDNQNNDPMEQFRRFFGGKPGGDDGGENGEARRALGSGFIVDPRGYIITNNHVVDKADKIYVKLSTDTDDADNGIPARVVGVDTETDIAVIKIDTKEPLPTVKMGNSDGAQVGDWVIAIGSPFALSQTVTAGIVSARNRSINEAGPDGRAKQFQRFIQTDAAINPGNSGGPLLDMAGEVIGVNTAIYTQSAGNEGVGFAMPSNIVIGVYNQLISPDHKVVRGSIGITFQSALSSSVGRVYGFKSGVLVNSVEPKGPAAAAGIQPGDVIVSIDGRTIKDGDDLVADISARHPGSSVKLGYMRNGKVNTATVNIADRAKLFAALLGGPAEDRNTPEAEDVSQSKLGISVRAVPSDTASKLGISGGVQVTSVRPGSFADDIGLPQGVVIVEVNRKPVSDVGSFNSIVSGLKSGDDVVFIVRNPSIKDGGNSYVGGPLP
jgi:serine protease Do